MLVSIGLDPFVLISSSMMLVKDHFKGLLGALQNRGKGETADIEGSVNKKETIKKKEELLSRSTIANILQRTATLKKNRKRGLGPSFADYFGWCTWDSFYTDLSSNRVLSGLESFRGTGVRPRFLILDDGWQVHHSQLKMRHSFVSVYLSVCLNVCLSVCLLVSHSFSVLPSLCHFCPLHSSSVPSPPFCTLFYHSLSSLCHLLSLSNQSSFSQTNPSEHYSG